MGPLLPYVGVLVGAMTWHLVVLYRLMPYRKDLLEGSTGLERFRSFVSQSWIENAAPRNYSDEARPYFKWYRASAIASVLALWGFVFAALARTIQRP
jgi:hypothetical protein